jgi:hypothetical protein
MDYDHETNINIIYFVGNEPYEIISDIPYPLGQITQYCSFCCSNINITIHRLYVNHGIVCCEKYDCTRRAHIALGYAYSHEMPLILEKPVNSHILSAYDNITTGYITQLYINNIAGNQLYSKVEWRTPYYNESKDVPVSVLLDIPENKNINLSGIINYNCSRYSYYDLIIYNQFVDLLNKLEKDKLTIEETIAYQLDNLQL